MIRRRFNVGVPRARVPEKNIHASRPFREMITRPEISRNEWKATEIGAFEVGIFAPFSCPERSGRSAETHLSVATEKAVSRATPKAGSVATVPAAGGSAATTLRLALPSWPPPSAAESENSYVAPGTRLPPVWKSKYSRYVQLHRI